MSSDGRSFPSLQRPFRWGPDGVSSPDRAFSLPVGTVTFLLTDVEGSTRMWSSEPVEVMRAAIARHHDLLAEAVDRNGGVRPQEQGEGDSIVAAFARPSDALRAALDAQLALVREPWPTAKPVTVRMAIHTGEAQLRDDANYAGQAIIRTARLRAIGHGGQVLVSGATRDLAVDQVGATFDLVSLGEHRLRDLGRPETVWQLCHGDLPNEFPPLLSTEVTPNSLPTDLSVFIGREPEIATLTGLVDRERLVTATGSGGAGKTRLAQQAGARLLDSFPAGVWWVELAPLPGDAVESALRSAFGISEVTHVAFEEAVRRRHAGERCLLIVDNCEHVAAEVAELLDRLLRNCPSLHVLATSRVSLDLPGELMWRVPPLGLPERAAELGVEALSQFDAVRLFCDRARRAHPSFQLTIENGPAVAEICHRLDGIPLAIELAAARCRVMAPSRILTGLSDAFHLLSGGSRTLMPRQQTLEASIAWSHDLLNEPERILLRRLAVFVGGWTLEAAEGVCADDDLDVLQVFDSLDRLVEHSLVQADDTPLGTRFRMLETVRQFAHRQLGENTTDEAASRLRHARWFGEQLAGMELRLRTSELLSLLPVIEAEADNLLPAMQVLVANREYTLACGALESSSQLAIGPLLRASAMRWALALSAADADLDNRQRAIWRRVHGDALLANGRIPEGLADTFAAADFADAAGDHAMAAQSRAIGLLWTGFAGYPIVDDIVALAPLAGTPDEPLWGHIGWLSAQWIAAYQGRVHEADRADSQMPGIPDDVTPIVDLYHGTARGIAAFYAGRPTDAIDRLLPIVGRPYWNDAGTSTFLVMAAVDVGQDVRDVADKGLIPTFRDEGSPIAGASLAAHRAMYAVAHDDLDTAAVNLREAVDLYEHMGFPGSWHHERYTLVAARVWGPEHATFESGAVVVSVSSSLRARAEVALREGRLPEALELGHETLGNDIESGGLRSQLFTLEFLARVLAASGRGQEAARLIGACEAFRAERGIIRVPCLQRMLDASGTAVDAVAVEEGRSLTLDQAADYARRFRSMQVTATSGWDALTPTERKVADLVAEGLSNPAVGKQLLMSPATVKTHLSRVFTKLGVANRQELVLAAARR
jgi:predicted ATPase/class 3 adenylate cyclase/DNA-binding CsgD family transcriptional regulator